jgi:hypothetical protein
MKEPLKAIEQYKLALKTSGHPFLYTNIASAYHRLGDYKNSANWFKKAEPLLLSLEDRYSANPYANYAYFLYNNKSYKKALTFSKIAIEIDSETMIFIENHARILLALKKIEDAIPYLAKLRLVVPDWASVQDLINNNKEEIDHYYDNFWNLKDKEATFEDIIRLHDLDKEKLLKYVISKKGTIPNIKYDKWDSIFKDMLSNGIEITDPYFIKLFKILIKREEFLKLFNFFNNMIENTETGYLLILKLMKLSGVKKKLVVQQLLKNVTRDNEPALIQALSKNLIPSYKKDLKEWQKELNNPIARVILIQVMQNTAQTYFKKEIKNYLEKNIDSKRFNLILSKLDDQKLKETLYLKKLSNWLNTIPEFKKQDSFFKLLKTFITGNKKNIIDKIIISYRNLVKNDSYFDFWDNFVNNFPSENNEDLYTKSFRLSLIFEPHTTLENHISFNKDLKTTLDLLAQNNIPITFYIKYLIKKIYKQDDKGKLIVEFINNYFKEVMESFELVSIKEKVAILPIIWENQRENFSPILLSLTASNSKTIQNTVKSLLKKDDTLTSDMINLLKARKVSTRTIATEVLLCKNDDKINKLLKKHLETEKSESIRKLINKVL